MIARSKNLENERTATLEQAVPTRLWALFLQIFLRDLKLAYRAVGQWLNPLVFYIIVVSLYPLGIGPAPNTLANIAPGLLWISALLAMMLSLDSLFARDYRDGTLEQFAVSGQPLTLIVLAKVMAHWVTTALPLVIISPLLGLVLQLPGSAYTVLLASLLLGTLSLSFIGAIGAALTVSVNQGGVLLSLLVLPLTVPVLIFGSSAVSSAAMGMDSASQLSFLTALGAFAISLAPLAIAGAIRVGVTAGH